MEEKFEIRGILDNPVEIEFSDPPQFSAACCLCKKLSLEMFSDDSDSKHLFCNFCVNREKVRCPEEKLYFGKHLTEDTIMNEIIQALTVYCIHKNEGCDHHGDLKHLKNHLQNGCAYHVIRCNFCNSEITSRFKHEHTVLCKRKYSSCEYCGEAMPEENQKKHFESCSGLWANCPFCNERKTKQEMTDHLDTCIKIITEENNAILKNEETLETKNKDFSSIQESYAKTQEIEDLKKTIGELKDRFKAQTEDQATLLGKLQKSEQEKLVIKKCLKQETEDNVNLKKTVEVLNTEIEKLKEENAALRRNKNEWEQRMDLEYQFDEENRRQKQKHAKDERTVEQQNVKINQMHEKFVCCAEGRKATVDLYSKIVNLVQIKVDNEKTIKKLKEKAESLNEEVVELTEKLRDCQQHKHFEEKGKDERMEEVSCDEFCADKERTENDTRCEGNELLDKLLAHITDPGLKTETRSEIVRTLRSAKVKQASHTPSFVEHGQLGM